MGNNLEKRIDVEGFISFVLTAHNDVGTPFERNLIRSIVVYGNDHHSVSKDQLAYFLSDVIPDIDFEDVIKFIADECLTDASIKLKKSK